MPSPPFASLPALATEPTPIRLGLVKFGTVAWEADTIRPHRLDEANGISLLRVAVSFAVAMLVGVAMGLLLGRSNGIGVQLQTYFQLFDVPRMIAYAAAFVLCVLAIEAAVFMPLERA